MFGRLSIVSKLLILVVFSVIVTAAALGFSATRQASTALKQSQENALSGIATSRRDALKQYLNSIDRDILTLSSNRMTLDALNAFSAGWDDIGDNPKNQLQQLYITGNPNPTGEKEKLDAAKDGSSYSDAHAEYHPWFREFLKTGGYYDIFLFRNDGELVYTVFKELDYATNMNTGEWSKTDLAASFRAAQKLRHGEFAFFDFEPYAPSYDAPASFISTPVFDADGVRQGVLAFQMPIDRINNVLQSRAGLGETGETFIIGSDGFMRSDAPRADASTILSTEIPAVQLEGSMSDAASLYEGQGYLGEDVFAVSVPLSFEGTEFHVIAQMNADEILAPVKSLQATILKWSIGLLLVIGAIAAFIVHRISSPISKIAAATQKIVEGEMDTVVPFQKRGDELGPLARAIDQFRVEMINSADLAFEQKRLVQQEKEEAEKRAEHGERLGERARKFDEIVSRTLKTFTHAAVNLDENASAMSAIAEETASQSQGIAYASQSASHNVQSVAAAAEELSVSVGEISSKMGTTRSATQKAVRQAEIMRERVSGLETAASEISAVIGLITQIAGQTNLLALNATIEAARAGEAGKGFAVVASEVKELATQTSKATGDISRQIAAIQETTSSSVSGIHDILTVISELESIASEVASAVEQQNSATLQISESIQNAAGSVQEVDGNIGGVNTAAQEAGVTATRMRDASTTLTEQSRLLQDEVESFLSFVRAA